jgi:hypothetical protein
MEQDKAIPDKPDQDRSAVVTPFGASSFAIVTFFYVYGSKRVSRAYVCLAQGRNLFRPRAIRP